MDEKNIHRRLIEAPENERLHVWYLSPGPGVLKPHGHLTHQSYKEITSQRQSLIPHTPS